MNRIEQMRADIIAELANVTTTNGYRTTIAKTATTLLYIDSIDVMPAVSVLLGDENLTAQDTTRQTWNSDLEVILLGYCMRTDAESLLHDLKRIAGKVSTKYSTQNNDRWFIAGKSPLFKVMRDMDARDERVFVSVGINARIFAQNSTFTN